MSNAKQSLTLRIYYEDTDFSGRVYHASYLRFFERGRTEWLRALGFHHGALASSTGIVFVVRRLQIEFGAPAFIDDLLELETELDAPRGAVLVFRQTISRDGVALASGAVEVVAVKGNRAVRPPRELLQALAGVKHR